MQRVLIIAGSGAGAARECRECKSVSPRESFSQIQWAKPTANGSLCAVRASEMLSKRTADGTSGPETVVFSDKVEATQFIAQTARGDELPPATAATPRAMGKIIGMDTTRRASERDPQCTGGKKHQIARETHAEEFFHAAGRCGVAESVKDVGRSWMQCPLDAQLVEMRCVEGARKAVRGCVGFTVRRLPQPLRSGECLGEDVGTIVPKNAADEKWVMILAVEFPPGEVFAWDMDRRPRETT